MKIFIAGARSITSLDDNVQKKLMSIYNKNYNVLSEIAMVLTQLYKTFL